MHRCTDVSIHPFVHARMQRTKVVDVLAAEEVDAEDGEARRGEGQDHHRRRDRHQRCRVRECARACVGACARVRVCVRARVRACVRARSRRPPTRQAPALPAFRASVERRNRGRTETSLGPDGFGDCSPRPPRRRGWTRDCAQPKAPRIGVKTPAIIIVARRWADSQDRRALSRHQLHRCHVRDSRAISLTAVMCLRVLRIRAHTTAVRRMAEGRF